MSQNKHECGYNHLTKEQWDLLCNDGADVFARLIQDENHNLLPPEVAMSLGKYAIEAGMKQLRIVMDNAVKLNQLTAAIAISGFAGDAPK